jgi:hypothetical protein
MSKYLPNENRFLKGFARNPHPTKAFFERPYFSRRAFFNIAAAGVGAMVLPTPSLAQTEVVKRGGMPVLGTAKNVIFIHLAGAPSHVDTFDLKRGPDTPLDLLKPELINGVDFPVGLMPKIAGQLSDMAIVRSIQPWALQHQLAQMWNQIGRSPAGALGDIAPNIGAIVAVEKEAERTAGQVFPTFLALNSDGGVGSGYMSADYAPFKISAPANSAASGIPDTTNVDGQARFQTKYDLMMKLDAPLRTANPYSKAMQDYDNFYTSGKAMTYNNAVNSAFQLTATESARYGNSSFGNACLTAAKVLAANGGTRFVQITLGGWDHHNTIYAGGVLPARTRELDNGVSAMLNDLKASGLLRETLVVIMGEFGRTVGGLNDSDGRDHYSQQFAVFAGAGVRGGRIIGKTSANGGETVESGWSRGRNIRFEDIEATIYSALGIDWGTIRYDDPFKRGFYYVPEGKEDSYAPIDELWKA